MTNAEFADLIDTLEQSAVGGDVTNTVLLELIEHAKKLRRQVTEWWRETDTGDLDFPLLGYEWPHGAPVPTSPWEDMNKRGQW